ncbi:MAG: HdeD family acid-resistance protein [Phycisphaeraceae bacterium]
MAYQAPALGTIPPAGLDELRRHWSWFVGVGIVLLAVGLGAAIYAGLTTAVSMIVLGSLLIVAGVVEGVHAFGEARWGGFFIDLFTAVLYVTVGFLLVASPQASAVALTLVIAMFLIVSGLFRGVAAVAGRPPHWGWLLLNGVVSLLLGILIWQRWPIFGLWAIGLYIGIEVMLNGVSLIAMGMVARKLPPGENVEFRAAA